MKSTFRLSFMGILLCTQSTQAISLHLTQHNTSLAVRPFELAVTFEPGQYVYESSLSLSSNHPYVILEQWKPTAKSVRQFDPIFNESRTIFNQSFVITGTLNFKRQVPGAALVLGFLTGASKTPEFRVLPLENNSDQQSIATIEKVEQQAAPTNKPAPTTILGCPAPHAKQNSFTAFIQKLVATTNALWLRLLLVLILGILMSLTPCIYPMIPITLGILQASKRTFGGSFIVALSYTCGIGTTFAIMGLAAATTGYLLGGLLTKPYFVLALIAILVYLALSLFGMYELKMPPLLMSQINWMPRGSATTAFVFGLLSGTIASPCLSPGLALLLSIVATLNSKIQGFLLLFTFGIGTSVPILLIGTFSGSQKLFPRSGLWMTEIKKIFGILLIALCFYYLGNIVSLWVLLWLMTAAFACLGIYYLYNISLREQTGMRRIKYVIAASAIACSIATLFVALQQTFYPADMDIAVVWHNDYQQAHTQAQNAGKLLFVDVGAPYCSICKAIDYCVLRDPTIAPLLSGLIAVKIDASIETEFSAIRDKFHIMGVPTLLLIDPNTDRVLARWGAELYNLSKTEFAKALGLLMCRHKPTKCAQIKNS